MSPPHLAVAAASPPSDAPPADVPPAVTVVLSNEILGRGIESMLGPALGGGVLRSARESLATRDLLGVVVVAADDGPLLAALAARADRARFQVLAVLPAGAPGAAGVPVDPVDGYLAPDGLTPAALHDAVLRCARGDFPLPAAFARALAGEARPARVSPPAPRLTARETETVALLVEGLTNVAIARRLGISAHGVKRLVGNVMIKLDAPNRTAAAVRAVDAGLVTTEEGPCASRYR